MKIVFFGSSEFAMPALKALKGAGFDLAGVVTIPDQPAGREHVLTPPPAKVAAQNLGLKVLQPASLDAAFLEEFVQLNPELCAVAAFGKIIPVAFLTVPKHRFLNIHPSLLPKYRGATPIQSAILHGETETGVTIMVVDEKMDHGGILAQTSYNLPPTTSYQQAHDDLAELGAKLLVEIIPKHVSGEIKPFEQDHNKATFTKMYSRIEGHLDWKEPATNVCNRIRGLNPNPGTWNIWKGALMNIRSAALLTTEYTLPTPNGPGTVIKQEKKILVMCGDGKLLELGKILLEGKKETTALDFSSGHPDFIGSKFE